MVVIENKFDFLAYGPFFAIGNEILFQDWSFGFGPLTYIVVHQKPNATSMDGNVLINPLSDCFLAEKDC